MEDKKSVFINAARKEWELTRDHTYDFVSLSWPRKIAVTALLGILILLVVTYIFILSIQWGAFGNVPDKDALTVIETAEASEIYTADSVLMGKFYIQERTFTPYEKIAPAIINALVATEDARFYKHDGVDRQSLLRVALKSILLQSESSGGGSTLSQQLAKNLFPRENHGRYISLPINKIKEMIIARRLEKVYSKQQILTLYLNTVPFGDNAFGIETASERYFSKPASKLNQQEAATLVGMLKATTTYNPRRYPDRSKGRRNVVLGQMEKYNMLSSTEADSLMQLPMQVRYKRVDHNEGMATYFREFMRPELEKWCKNQTGEDGKPLNLYRDGLKIYTTIDSKLQQYAETAMREHMKDLQATFYKHWGRRAPWSGNSKVLVNAIHRSQRYRDLKAEEYSEKEIQEVFKEKVDMKIFTWQGERDTLLSPLDSVKHYLYYLNAGFVAMNPHSGAVQAWVGGINHRYFQYDHVNKHTRRQVGSTFKPIVYAAALQQGADPCTYISAEKVTYPELDNWSPGNSDGKYEGEYTLEGGLINSVNTVSVKVLKRTGLSNAISLAKAMGIENDIPKLPSIALGTPELSLIEMVGAYTTFANRGRAVKPVYLRAIADRKGKLLQGWGNPEPLPLALEPDKAELMVHMLQSVINKGTGQRLRWKYKLNNEIAGKTGTTQSHADGWFIGVTPNLVAGSWVGADDPGIRFRSTALGQGANTALPIFGKFLQQVNSDSTLENIAKARFNLSKAVIAQIDCEPYREPLDIDLFERIFGKTEEDKERGGTRKPGKPTPQNRGRKKKKSIIDRLFGND